MTLEVGRRLLHYRIERLIGKGGMGEVYAAEDTKLQRRVALKVLSAEMAADPDRLARFEREARAVAALNHPNIVTLHAVEEVEGIHFISMELIEGRVLSNIVPSEGFDTRELLEIATPLADAVSRAHREGITHRDLKPDNIMIDGDGRLRVLDFGLAKLCPSTDSSVGSDIQTEVAVTQKGTILGTVAYMSPEQAEGKDVDARSDVFSLGTILYEMATGVRPFKGDAKVSVMAAILNDEPVPVTEIKPSLPYLLGRIIRRCMTKDPERRYQNALALRNELEELKGEIDSGGTGSGVGSLSPPSRLTVRPLWLLVAAVVLAIALLYPILKPSSPKPADRVYSVVPVTSNIDQDSKPTWSPESDFIAFSRTREGSVDLMVQPVTGGESSVRVGGPGDERPASWSPDGRFLAYASTSDPGVPIHLVPPHGGRSQKLIETGMFALDAGSIDAALGNLPWDPESRKLLVTRVSDSGRLAIFRVNVADGEAEQLTFPPRSTDDRSASYSFDGQYIVFERRSESRGALMRVPAAGGEPEVLLDDEFDNEAPAFRPDGRSVLFLSDRGNAGFDLWELNLETNRTVQLTFESQDVGSYSVSASNRVVYAPFWHDTFLYVVDVSTGVRRQVTSHTRDNFGAQFSADGESIAYHSTRTGNAEVFLHPLDGSPEIQVTNDPGWDGCPDWSPDGRHVIFASSRLGGEFRLFIANSDGGGERLLLDKPISVRNEYGPAALARLVSRWSPDGNLIGYLVSTETSTSLWTVGADGEGAKEVLADVLSFDWYRDRSHVVYARRSGLQLEMVATNLESGAERSLFVGAFMEMEVAPDGNAVAFCFGPGHSSMGLALLKLEPPADSDGLPMSVGEPELVVPTEGTWHVHNGGWSPDSRSLVYTQDLDHGDLFELVATR